MIRHAALIGISVVLLVVGLLYSISPGEVRMVYSIARNRVSTHAPEVMEAKQRRGTRETDPLGAEPDVKAVRKVIPDPFRPFVGPQALGADGSWAWPNGRQAVVVWMAMAAFLLARGYARRRRCKVLMEQKMALNLSKAVRQMRGPVETI